MRTTEFTITFPDGSLARASVIAASPLHRVPVLHSGPMPAIALKPEGLSPTVLESALRQFAQVRGGELHTTASGDYANQDDLS